ncbi:MAG: ABC transporter ATP-binding protein [Clostridia bacterium]|nr:ABC transporter ATP-binding protein [Clostridia bacterium]
MAILEVDSVIKQYKQYDVTVTAVNRASIKVEDGEFIAIIGSSGSGKSTFLNLCAGLDVPNAGTIKIRGNDITKMNPDKLSRFRGNFTGFIYQKHNLIPHLTALENILIPTHMCNKEEFRYEEHLKKLIRALDLGDRLHHLPSELSGGQQQRVAIARAMINRPQILFADEPTGNLDRDNADEVLRLLLATKEELGQTLMMVTHDLTIAEHADKIYKMDNGRLTLFKDKRGYRLNSFAEEAKAAESLSRFEESAENKGESDNEAKERRPENEGVINRDGINANGYQGVIGLREEAKPAGGGLPPLSKLPPLGGLSPLGNLEDEINNVDPD